MPPGELFLPNRKTMLPAPPVALTEKASSLTEYRKEGYEIFSLAPLYVYGEIPESLPEAFARSKQPNQPRLDTQSTQLRFSRIVIEHCDAWGSMLEIMDRASYIWFKQWIQAFTLVNKEKKLAMFPRIYSAAFLDPIALDQDGKAVPDSIEVWSIATPKWSLIPVTSSGIAKQGEIPATIKMKYGPPEQLAQQIAQQMQPEFKAVLTNDLKRAKP